MKRLLTSAALLLALSGGALAQAIGGNVSIAVDGTGERAALPASTTTYPAVLIAPAFGSTVEVFYRLGNGSVVATTSNAALPSGGICVNVGNATNVAAIVASGSANVRITQLTSCALFAGGSSSGGGGGSGTSSNFAASFPTAGTAIGVKSGANMVNLTADGSNNLNVNCAVGCVGGTFNNNASGVATSASNGQAAAWSYIWNGSTWDQMPGTAAAGIKAVVTNAGTFPVQATLAAETTKVIGTVNQGTSPWVVSNGGTFAAQVTGTVTANAGTNLNTSLLALETGGNLAQIVTDFGAPGAIACTTDTASCNQNQQLQRIAQRLTTINTTLGTPFQAGGSIGNTTFAVTNAGTFAAQAAQSGTWTVQPGNTPNTSPWLMSISQGGSTAVVKASNTVATTDVGLVVAVANTLPPGQAALGSSSPVAIAKNSGTGSTIAGAAVGTAGSAATEVVTIQGVASMTKLLVTPDANSSVNLSQVNGVTTLTGTGASGTGAQRITVSTDQATNAGAALVKGGVGVVNGGSFYQAVAASQTGTTLQSSTGAAGDYLSHCVIYPATTSPGAVTVFDSTNVAANSVVLFAGGASSVSNLAPISIPIGALSINGAWKVTTLTNVSTVCYGKFS